MEIVKEESQTIYLVGPNARWDIGGLALFVAR
jgi:hypothetical protein